MSSFDDCTLAEVEEITSVCLGGKSIGDESADPMMLAGGVMWVFARRDNPPLSWDEFKATTKMSDIKAFSIQMEADNLDDVGKAAPATI